MCEKLRYEWLISLVCVNYELYNRVKLQNDSVYTVLFIVKNVSVGNYYFRWTSKSLLIREYKIQYYEVNEEQRYLLEWN